MAIGKIGGIMGSSCIRPILRRLETDPAPMQGAEACVKGRGQSAGLLAESVVAVH
jgi:hypothetical protein